MTARKPTRAKALGVSDARYYEMLDAQGGHCALCPTKPKTRRLHVDHDHTTIGPDGHVRIRGLLCYSCNRILTARATEQWLLRAAVYVREPQT